MSFSDPVHHRPHSKGLRHETNYSKATARTAARSKAGSAERRAFFMRAARTHLDAHRLLFGALAIIAGALITGAWNENTN